jgi:hypothetical protein
MADLSGKYAMQSLSESQKRALLWLHNHNAEGCFTGRGAQFIAAGEIAPVARSTWNQLVGLGLVLRPAATPKRIKLTGVGRAVAERIENAREKKPNCQVTAQPALAA